MAFAIRWPPKSYCKQNWSNQTARLQRTPGFRTKLCWWYKSLWERSRSESNVFHFQLKQRQSYVLKQKTNKENIEQNKRDSTPDENPDSNSSFWLRTVQKTLAEMHVDLLWEEFMSVQKIKIQIFFLNKVLEYIYSSLHASMNLNKKNSYFNNTVLFWLVDITL